jgi:hypothetical protein
MDKEYDRAWKLLINPSRWCQESLAKDIYGEAVHFTPERILARDIVNAPEAVSWCTSGAIVKIYKDEATAKMDKFKRYLSCISLPHWNDHTTHAEVVAKLQEVDI